MTSRLTIGEFARRSGLSVSALRFYDGVGLLVPATVDGRTGYRTYEEGQLEPAELVRDLRRLEMPLSTIRDFLMSSPELRQKALRHHVAGMVTRLGEIESVARNLAARINQLEDSMTTMTVDGAALGEAIDQVVPAASSDPEFPALHTVLIEARDASLRLVATDRYRLAVRDLVARSGDRADFRAVVASASLARIRASLDASDSVGVSLDERTVVIALGDGDVRLNVVPAEFPPYERFFGTDPGARAATVGRVELVEALAAIIDRDVVRIELGEGRVRLDVESAVDIDATCEGPAIAVGLNPRFAHYAVSSSLGPEVVIEVIDPVRPVVFRSATDSSYICMLMPIKLT